MNNKVLRLLLLGGAVVLSGVVAYVGGTWLARQPTTGLIASPVAPSAITTPIILPSPTRRPTDPPPTRTPTPVPTPTVGYLTLLPTALPDIDPATDARVKGKLWSPLQRALLIDQDAQQIYVYKNGQRIKTIPCSTGKPILDHFTPMWTGRGGYLQGTIFSFGVYADNAWYLYKASGNILIHGAPYVYVNGEKVYQDLDALGHYPSSHGCIRVHPTDADWLTAWNLEGVPIIVMPWRGGFIE